MDAPGRLVGPGEGDAGDARIGNERRPDRFAVADHAAQDVGRDARGMQDLDGTKPDARCLLGRLGDDAVSRRQRRRDLAGEDREGEVPGRDAGKHAASVQAQLVSLTRRTRQELSRREMLACLQRVVAAEIRRLAYLRNGVGVGTAAFANDQRHQLLDALFHRCCGALERRCADRRQGHGSRNRTRHRRAQC